MQVRGELLSPNFNATEIPVEFLVLHYTACSLERALELFMGAAKTCAHFVLDESGVIYDLGGFLHGPIRQGAHAGESFCIEEGKEWRTFNQFSVGIEIVNLNGNLFPFTPAQYQALADLTRHLRQRFPALANPARIIGHEQIAGSSLPKLDT